MSRADNDLRALAAQTGVHLSFHDLSGQKQEAAPETLRALLRALGRDATTPASVADALAAAREPRPLPPVIVAQAGVEQSQPVSGACDWSVSDDAGTEIAAGRAKSAIALPALPMGYLTLRATGRGWQAEALILSRPARAASVAEVSGAPRGWGATGALYGLRGPDSGGVGSYADLGTAAQALGGAGAAFLGVNPIHALGWASDAISPYSPSHRGFFNTDHIAVAGLGPASDADLIDYAAFRARQHAALEHAFRAAPPPPAFAAYRTAEGPTLEDFARFEALSETHGEDFRDWPAQPAAPDPDRVTFHAWLQWLADDQIRAAQSAATGAGMGLGLYLDLAVGARPGGAEAWAHRDVIAEGVSIGAPPDHLAPGGQMWNLAALAPTKLRAQHYRPLRAMLGRLMARAGVLRIDHVLGLLRSFWVPYDGSPGGYVSQPFEELLAVVAIESATHGCVVVGEDLGLVPEGFRETVNATGLLSYAVWQYESAADGGLIAPGDLRRFALAGFGTHDTPTIRGFWHGIDIDHWRRLGWLGPSDAERRHGARAVQRASLRHLCALPPDADTDAVADAIHATLAGAPAVLRAVQLDDIFGCTEAQNLPGTVDEHPNWRRRLPVTVAQMTGHPALRRIGGLMAG